MKFEDLNTYDGRHTEYPVCNESVAVWRKALQGISVDNAAAICSGGEVSFFGILPFVTKQLQAIDHSYTSMYYAVGKYHIIEKLGAKEAYKVFTNRELLRAVMPLFASANKKLPTDIVTKNAEVLAKRYKRYDTRYQRTYGSQHYDDFDFIRLDHWSMVRSYTELSEADFKDFRANRGKITFLHGDLNDLQERGPFDLVYLSNAMQYNGRDNHKNYEVAKMVKPGGFVCFTQGTGNMTVPTPVRGFEEIFNENGCSSMYWNYRVMKAPA